MKYVVGIDQSTQGTKLILFDENGRIKERVNREHRQIVNELGWVSHDMQEIFDNVLEGMKELLQKASISGEEIVTVGICNQRETTVAWGTDGMPLSTAIVWQCTRAEKMIAEMEQNSDLAEYIAKTTGIPISPYFPAAKMKWLLKNELGDVDIEQLHLGTVDSYLIYRLTEGAVFATDASNASRTQLFNIHNLSWDSKLCDLFQIPMKCLPKVRDSNANYGETDFCGILPRKVTIHGVLGDSHGALYGQGCHRKGMLKTTYGTGSSMMLNIGEKASLSKNGLATSLAWCIDGKPMYVLEGNINYTGAVISWLKNDIEIISSVDEVNSLCEQANAEDKTILIPAFTGLSAPYWRGDVKASILSMGRTTRKAEIVRAAVESIANQVADVYEAMEKDYQDNISEFRADGGPTSNKYLMKYQSSILNKPVMVASVEELSVIGVAYMAGIAFGIYTEEVFLNISYKEYQCNMLDNIGRDKRTKWKEAMKFILNQ